MDIIDKQNDSCSTRNHSHIHVYRWSKPTRTGNWRILLKSDKNEYHVCVGVYDFFLTSCSTFCTVRTIRVWRVCFYSSIMIWLYVSLARCPRHHRDSWTRWFLEESAIRAFNVVEGIIRSCVFHTKYNKRHTHTHRRRRMATRCKECEEHALYFISCNWVRALPRIITNNLRFECQNTNKRLMFMCFGFWFLLLFFFFIFICSFVLRTSVAVSCAAKQLEKVYNFCSSHSSIFSPYSHCAPTLNTLQMMFNCMLLSSERKKKGDLILYNICRLFDIIFSVLN